jgi:hypothetical protein
MSSWKTRPENSPTHFMSKLTDYFEYFLKSDKNKKRPLGEKFAQSGHPAGGSM